MEITKCALADKWINKVWYSHTPEHYSAVTRGEMSNPCNDLDESQGSMLSDRRHCMIPFTDILEETELEWWRTDQLLPGTESTKGSDYETMAQNEVFWVDGPALYPEYGSGYMNPSMF